MHDVIDAHDLGTERVGAEAAQQTAVDNKTWWLNHARTAYTSSTDWVRSYKQPDWTRNLAHLHSKHAPGSKYYRDDFRQRSKGFRPLTKTVVARNLAACQAAFFSTPNAMVLEATSPVDTSQEASAALWQEIMQHRLDKSIPWQMTVLGAFHDTMVYDRCFAHVGWSYEEASVETVVIDEHGQWATDEQGAFVTQTQIEVVEDKPVIDLIKPQDMLFSLDADWRDPLNTATSLIERRAVTTGVVRQRMESGKYREAALVQGRDFEYDAIEAAQSNNKTPPNKDEAKAIKDHETLLLLRVITKVNGIDWIYETLGTNHLLTDPKPLREEYKHGKRPYVSGVSELESHSLSPDGLLSQVAGLQGSANDLDNLRMDGVRLGLVPRLAVKSGAKIDTRALSLGTPGITVQMDDPRNDVRELKTSDVTQGSFAQQDRINGDFDTLAGNFSQSSVATNRKLGETMGGMEMISNDANAITNFRVSLFAATFVTPALELLLLTEQVYEGDTVILNLAAEKSSLVQRFGVDEITDDLLMAELSINIDVGVDATNTTRAVEKIRLATSTSLELGLELNRHAIGMMIWSKLGFKDAERLLPDPENQPPAEAAPDPAGELAMQKIEFEREKLQMQHQWKMNELDMKLQIEALRVAATEKVTLAEVESRIQQAVLADQTKRDIAAANTTNFSRELKHAEQTGRGI